MTAAGSVQSINIVEQSVTVTEPDAVAMLNFRLQKPICSAPTAHKQFFFYVLLDSEREGDRKKVCWRGGGGGGLGGAFKKEPT